MSDPDSLTRALQRERKARAKAEQLLEDRSRELFLSNQSLQDQNILLHNKNKELELFFTIAKIGEKEINTRNALQFYIESVCNLCNWPVGHIYFAEAQENEIKLIPSPLWHLRDKSRFQTFIDITQETIFNEGEGLPGRIHRNQQALWISDVFQEVNFPRSKQGVDIGLRGAFGVPVFRYGKVIAVAEFFSENHEAENQGLLNTVETAATQLSTVLERRLSESKLKKNYEKLQQAHEQLKSTQTQLVQSSKLASIGQLAAGVAHEINNPIAFVSNNTSVLKKYITTIKTILEKYHRLLLSLDNPPHASALKNDIEALTKKSNFTFMMTDIDGLIADSLEGMERVTEIVSGLKNFARLDESDIKEANINECIESTIKIIWNALKYKCTLKKELSELPIIRCYPSQLNQVFMNLLVNADQAITDSGEITIKTYTDHSHIVIEITDTGAGIPEADMDKLFDPFFTTKPVGTGTGLGLSISYGIIQKHHGQIIVSSTQGVGTTFQILLPIAGVPDIEANETH